MRALVTPTDAGTPSLTCSSTSVSGEPLEGGRAHVDRGRGVVGGGLRRRRRARPADHRDRHRSDGAPGLGAAGVLDRVRERRLAEVSGVRLIHDLIDRHRCRARPVGHVGGDERQALADGIDVVGEHGHEDRLALRRARHVGYRGRRRPLRFGDRHRDTRRRRGPGAVGDRVVDGVGLTGGVDRWRHLERRSGERHGCATGRERVRQDVARRQVGIDDERRRARSAWPRRLRPRRRDRWRSGACWRAVAP